MGVHQNTVFLWIKNNRIPYRVRKTPKLCRYLIDWTAFQAWSETHPTKGNFPRRPRNLCPICHTKQKAEGKSFCRWCLSGVPPFDEDEPPPRKKRRSPTYHA